MHYMLSFFFLKWLFIYLKQVIDIEEMIWAPRFGLKGMIDASMHVKVEVDNQKATMKVMPFEFKTGRGTTGQASSSW